jgi:two-component system chemotaxis sensor kinase CheA
MSSQSKIVLTRYARIVSDLSRSLKKQVALNIERNEAWARPDIWDKCHNALVHLVRNSLDHGLELPEEREELGKEKEGRINISIHEDFKNIYISIEDDGRGIDGDRISRAAIDKGAVSENEVSQMTEEEKIKLIFRPDLSTKEAVTDVSGRGVGMDAVAKAIEESLKGYVHVTSEKNKGTHFLLEIPKSETLTECVLFGSDRHTYAIPVVSGIEYLECNPKYLKKVFAKTDMYTEGDLELPLLNIFQTLHPSEYDRLPMDYLPIIKIDNGSSSFGLVTPKIRGQERIKIDRSSVHKKVSMDTGLIFGYGLTDPITVVLDVDQLMAMV